MTERRTIKGRGTATDMPGRFESTVRVAEDDGWFPEDADVRAPQTLITEERARSILSRNTSPDVPFSVSLNPYRGCEHGCSYCFARPTHSYLNLSPGLDFETKLFAKTNAADVLRSELAKPGYRCAAVTIGTNTDPYQPIERRYRITRQVLEVFAETRHPVAIITKNALVERDVDLLAKLAADNLVRVYLSITTLDNRLSSRLEPRATAPHRRVAAVRRLSEAGIPVGVLVAPLIPSVTDQFLEQILEQARAAGAVAAGYVMLRLPHEVKEIFRDWLAAHLPERAGHVMSLVRQMRGGRDYDASFGTRMRGEGVFADLIKQRFELTTRRLGFPERRHVELNTTLFRPPRPPSPQSDFGFG
ncbi:MAG: PA0069 family radical SAM protein [Tahibacter sp.]